MSAKQQRANYRASGDRYWRPRTLESTTVEELKDILRQKNHHFRSRDTKDILLEKVQRLDAGKILYEECTVTELREFATQRQLQMPYGWPIRLCDHEELVHILQTADKTATFSRLFDLPPELRSNIFAEYLGEFPDFLTNPIQPPLARASQQLRKEALPTFYSTAGFSIYLDHRARVVFERVSLGFMQSLAVNDYLGSIRSLRLRIRNLSNSVAYDEFHIDVSGSERDFCITISNNLTDDTALPVLLRDGLMREFRDAFGEIKERDGKEKLKLDDIYKLRRKIEELVR